MGLKDSIFPGRPVWQPPCPTWQPAPRPVCLLWRLLRAQTHLPSPSLSKAMQIECSVCILLWWVRLLWQNLMFNPVSCALHLATALFACPQCRCQLCLFSALRDEGRCGRGTGAQGLSKAGSWSQASGAMVTVTIETQPSTPTRICRGFHRMEPTENWVVVRASSLSSEGQILSWGPTCVLICLSRPSVLAVCSLGGFGHFAVILEYVFWLLHGLNPTYLPSLVLTLSSIHEILTQCPLHTGRCSGHWGPRQTGTLFSWSCQSWWRDRPEGGP